VLIAHAKQATRDGWTADTNAAVDRIMGLFACAGYSRDRAIDRDTLADALAAVVDEPTADLVLDELAVRTPEQDDDLTALARKLVQAGLDHYLTSSSTNAGHGTVYARLRGNDADRDLLMAMGLVEDRVALYPLTGLGLQVRTVLMVGAHLDQAAHG
jgi:hypothetical protein